MSASQIKRRVEGSFFKPPREPKPKRRSWLKRTSAKMRHSLAIYASLKSVYLMANHRCEFLWRGMPCGSVNGLTVHHKRGRGKFLNDPRWFIALCSRHHRYVHNNPAYSYEHGYMLPRFKSE